MAHKIPVTHLGLGNAVNPRTGQLFHDLDRNVILSFNDDKFRSTQIPEGWINVKDYGAKGDYNPDTTSGTDDTQAFLAALSDASDGTVIYIPTGKYLISQSLNITKNIVIKGNSLLHSELYFKADQPVSDPAISSIGGDSSNRQFITINDISIFNVSNFNGDGVLIQNCPRHSYLNNVRITDFLNGVGLRIKEDNWIKNFYNLYIDHCKYGVYFDETPKTVGVMGGNFNFYGGEIVGCTQAIGGYVSGLNFFGTTLEGCTGQDIENDEIYRGALYSTLQEDGINHYSSGINLFFNGCWIENDPAHSEIYIGDSTSGGIYNITFISCRTHNAILVETGTANSFNITVIDCIFGEYDSNPVIDSKSYNLNTIMINNKIPDSRQRIKNHYYGSDNQSLIIERDAIALNTYDTSTSKFTNNFKKLYVKDDNTLVIEDYER